ncbi:MAG TPA: hypothetical protein VFN06_00435, partial [Gaiellaceae bacterium]|nr:hypothetical protein [Gaiellaceae bacterium]
MRRKATALTAAIAALAVLVFGVVSATAGSKAEPVAAPHNHASHASQSQGLTQSDLRALLGRQLGEHAAL